jgi:hypothetical protein
MRPRHSFELVRVWAANKMQHVSLRVATWNEPAAWGIMLAHLARHIGDAYKQEEKLDPLPTLQRIKAGFDAEMASPTDHPTGNFVT